MMDHMNDVPDDVEIPNTEQIPDSQNNQSEHEISQNYEGAPEMVRIKYFLWFFLSKILIKSKFPCLPSGSKD